MLIISWGGLVHRNEILNITQFTFSCAFTENVLWGSASLFLVFFPEQFFRLESFCARMLHVSHDRFLLRIVDIIQFVRTLWARGSSEPKGERGGLF